MKNKFLLMAIALVFGIAVIGFMAACAPADDGGDDGEIETSITYTYDMGGYIYTLIIAEDFYRAAYKPKSGNEYFMIINSKETGVNTYSIGTIKDIAVGGKTEEGAAATTKGDVFTLVGGENVSFKVTIENNKIIDIDGTIPRVNTIPFNTEEHFEKWISVVPANTTDTPYPVRLNLSGFSSRQFYTYFDDPNKYFSLDLNSSGAYIMEHNAFGDCNSLVSVIIGSGITGFDTFAFSDCANLTRVTIGDSVTSFGSYTFYNCANLTSVTLGNGVTSIGERAFWDCSSLTSITIPNGVTSIGQGAFFGCSSLATINIPDSAYIGWDALSGTAWLDNQPDGVVYAGKVAYSYKGDMPADTNLTLLPGTKVIHIDAFSFQNNNTVSNLTSITIPNSVTNIETYTGRGAFWLCDNLTTITVAADNPTYSSDGGILYNKAKTEIVGVPRKINGYITIPNTITSIEDDAFRWCENLTGVTIPNSVTSIGEGAFAQCENLASVTIGNGVISIGEQAFTSCHKLTSVTIGNSVTSIGNRAFLSCSNLGGVSGSITIPNSVTSIGVCAFWGCGLNNVTFEGSGISMGVSENPGFSDGSSMYYAFDGDLHDKYLAGGAGTYTGLREEGLLTWTKQ